MGRNAKRNAALQGMPAPVEEEEKKPKLHAEPRDDEEHEVEIPLEEDADDDADDEPSEAASPQQSEKQRKKRERYEKLKAETERQAQERIAAAEAARHEAEQRAAYVQGAFEAQQRAQQTPESPYDAEIKRARKRKEELQILADKMTPEERAAKWDELNEEWNKENEAENAAMLDKRIEQRNIRPPQDPNVGIVNHFIQKHASDILQAPQHVKNYGIITLRGLVELGYAPNSEETIQLAAQKTREAFPDLFPQSNGKRSAPKPRASMMSVRSTGGPPVNGGGERKAVKMNRHTRGIARAAYPNLPPEQAVQRWAKKHAEWLEQHPEEDD